MRFKKRIPKKIWSEEKTRDKISFVRQSISSYNKSLNDLNKEIKILLEEKEIIKRKLQRKWKYLAQLQNQLGDSIHERIMKEYQEKQSSQQ